MQVYTNIRRFKEDLTQFPPHFFICVPLVLDTLYNRVRPCSQTGGSPSFVLALRTSSYPCMKVLCCWDGGRVAGLVKRGCVGTKASSGELKMWPRK